MPRQKKILWKMHNGVVMELSEIAPAKMDPAVLGGDGADLPTIIAQTVKSYRTTSFGQIASVEMGFLEMVPVRILLFAVLRKPSVSSVIMHVEDGGLRPIEECLVGKELLETEFVKTKPSAALRTGIVD